MPFYNDERWLGWLDLLATDDYVIIDDGISIELFETILQFFVRMEENDQLVKAGIGRLDKLMVKSEIRGDFIHWLDSEIDTDLNLFFLLMDELKDNLKKFCYLSLSDSEFHIAKYPIGSHYHKHLDQFNERSNRQISVLLYLNKNWKNGDGGELKIYSKNGATLIEPLARRIVLFKSAELEHEVLTTHVARYSLTGWLLRK
ncbi:MAG: 2OG-Fe(II) oxygenase [Balneolaceae bacterium]|nr:2OG-Fe(II) oxygenase [Balneolaceae bacterium]